MTNAERFPTVTAGKRFLFAEKIIYETIRNGDRAV